MAYDSHYNFFISNCQRLGDQEAHSDRPGKTDAVAHNGASQVQLLGLLSSSLAAR